MALGRLCLHFVCVWSVLGAGRVSTFLVRLCLRISAYLWFATGLLRWGSASEPQWGTGVPAGLEPPGCRASVHGALSHLLEAGKALRPGCGQPSPRWF